MKLNEYYFMEEIYHLKKKTFIPLKQKNNCSLNKDQKLLESE